VVVVWLLETEQLIPRYDRASRRPLCAHHGLGFVNRVYEAADLERETTPYCQSLAESTPGALRMAKVATNRTQDIQGYANAVNAAVADCVVMMNQRGGGVLTGCGRRVGGPAGRE